MTSMVVTRANVRAPDAAQGVKPLAASAPRGTTKPPYPAEFRREAVRLVRDGRAAVAQVARDLGISQDTLRAWVKQAAVDGGRREGLTTEERQELVQLRREVKRLEEEREILKKAAAFFAAESATR